MPNEQRDPKPGQSPRKDDQQGGQQKQGRDGQQSDRQKQRQRKSN